MHKTSNKLGPYSSALLGINSILGAGIFLVPPKLAELVGIHSLWVIVLGAVLVSTIAMCYAEAAGRFSGNGGTYLYVRAAFGEFAGFQVGFMKWIIGCIGWATSASGFATLCRTQFPALNTAFYHNILIIGLIGLLSVINLLGIKASKTVNNIVTVAKIIPLLLFLVLGIFFIESSNFSLPLPQTDISVNPFAQTLLLVFYLLTGFEAISTTAGEMKEAQKYVPWVMTAVFVSVSLLYFSVQFVSIGILGETLKNSENPLLAASVQCMGPTMSMIITGGALISILGVNSASAFTVPFVGVALAEDKLFFPALAKRSNSNVPYISILTAGIVTCLLAVSGSFATLATISILARFTQYLPTCLAVIVLRKKHPNHPSTFQLPFGWTIPIIAVLSSTWMVMQSSFYQIAVGLGAFVFSIPLYYWIKHKYSKLIDR